MVIYGIHSVTEALRAEDRSLERILVQRGKANPRLQKIIELARNRGVPVRFESPEVLHQKASTPNHQEVVAEVSPIEYVELSDILRHHPTLLLMVAGVEDPHNLGALLRTAEAVGVEGVLIPSRRACPVTPTVVKCSAGAALHLRIARIGNVRQTLEKLKREGLWVVGLDPAGTTHPSLLDTSLPLVVIVGGEQDGLSRLVRQHCDFLTALPMKGRVASLNLSVAAGVFLYQVLLRRGGDLSA